MMRILKWAAIACGVVLLALGGAIAWLKSTASARYAKTYAIRVDALPIPFPLSQQERALLGADELRAQDLDRLALERAIERGKRYLQTRAVCRDCHGDDLGGKIIVENVAMGRWVAPNITRGGVIQNYTPEDWVRIIRHGVRPNGTAANMPAIDFTDLSDQEISDIATYVQSLPSVQRTLPPTEIGPLLALLIVKGDFQISAEVIDHSRPRRRYPPDLEPSTELGQHLASTCRGCHGPTLAGGPILGADPAWPPAKNLTFHESGLAGWSSSDFTRALREGIRPDGKKIDPVMPIQYTSRLSDAELNALYAYLKTVSPKAYGSN